MNEIKQSRKWFKKKRYIIPLSIFGMFLSLGIIGAAVGPTSPTAVQSVQTSTKPSVNTENIALPQTINVIQDKEEEVETNSNQNTATKPSIYQSETNATPAPNSTTTTKTITPSNSNGTYTNSAGNKVQSPVKAPSKPVGASAQCRDGTYSFSQSRSGTCSHHGGVATWF